MKNLLYVSGKEKMTKGYYGIWMYLSSEGLFTRSNMLMILQSAKHVESKSEEQLKDEVTEVLRAMYGPQVPKPEALIRGNWCTNPLTQGSYHTITNGLTPEKAKNLSANIGNLYFAGKFTLIL